MRCELCQRQPEPADRGWVSVMARYEYAAKPTIFNYCPTCTDPRPATGFDRDDDED